jgi:hypothetical protein
MLPGKAFRSPEFELVLACTRWPLEAAGAVRIRELARQHIRWPHLLDILQHHQVTALVSRNLEACAAEYVPQEPLTTLRTRAVENVRASFQNISELVRLVALFREEHIEVRVLKGAPLAIAAFGDPTLRGTGDIDLLIGEPDLLKANAILRSVGYLPSEPAAWLTAKRMRSYIAHQKDFSYESRQTGMVIDLHWRFFRNHQLPSNAGLKETGLSWVQLGPECIPTLPPEQLFLYLCVHGALDGWLRLKWLADIGALLNGFSQEQIRAIAQTAMARRILPEFSAAVLLCQQELGFERLPAECLDPREPSVARILRLARRLMAANDHCPDRNHVSSATWFLNEFFLHSSLSYRAELIQRSLFRPRVWEQVSLPDALFPLYAILSPVEWLTFRVQRLMRASPRPSEKREPLPDGRPRRGLLERFFGLAPAELALLAEAAIMLLFFRIALKFFSVQRLTTWMNKADARRPVPPENQASQNQASRNQASQVIRSVEWAVGAVVRHAPITFVCFPQSLAAYFMLLRRHVRSKMFYGVTREEQQLKAHTWIKVGDRTVVGGEAESLFTVLAIFP